VGYFIEHELEEAVNEKEERSEYEDGASIEEAGEED
jgi:hypothetical protein